MGNGNKVEFIVAVCALVTSVVAVYIAWDQARVMRTQQRADVWPVVQLSHNTDVRGERFIYELTVENAGVGPALLEGYQLAIPGAPEGGLAEFMAYLLPAEFSPPGPHTYNSVNGRVMRQGTALAMIGGSWEASSARQAAFDARLSAYIGGERAPPVVRLCYCSILEDCWIASSEAGETRPQAVRDCSDYSARPDVPPIPAVTPTEEEPRP